MRSFIVALISVVFNSFVVSAQTPENSVVGKHVIEVTGTAETEVTPDEIYITITLLERNEGKDKVSIDKQEADLRQLVKDLGIDAGNLTLAKADADYRKIKSFKRDVMISKSYLLKINNAELLSKVYERLDKMNAQDAFVSKYTHSGILELQKENRIKAIKAAKEKVDYLLSAIGQQAGQALQITESANYVEDGAYPMPRNAYLNASQSMADGNPAGDTQELSFKKIKIRSSFIVKYEILNK
ncbi:MAG: SIMPL domain-containing protein [bacterium]|nr:SIMPL domain-containing protein [bacterium]